jgi:alcohol dehydrogenase class IV
LVLPHVLRFNTPDAAHVYAEIAADAFPYLAAEQGVQARCAGLIDALAALSRKLGLQTKLRDVGIEQAHLPKMAADAMLQQRLLVNNPRTVSEADALSIYRAAW